MLNKVLINLLMPILGRLGTVASTSLVGWGAQQQHADWVGIGITGLVLVSCDILISWARQRIIVNKVFAEVVGGILGNGEAK